VKLRVRVLRRAQHDLFEIQAYLRRETPGVADQRIEELLQAIESLKSFARRGAVPKDSRLRRAGYRFLLRDPYLVFSKATRSQARVYRVLHGKRTWRELLEAVRAGNAPSPRGDHGERRPLRRSQR
jgi:toxin ParE1/3/4